MSQANSSGGTARSKTQAFEQWIGQALWLIRHDSPGAAQAVELIEESVEAGKYRGGLTKGLRVALQKLSMEIVTELNVYVRKTKAQKPDRTVRYLRAPKGVVNLIDPVRCLHGLQNRNHVRCGVHQGPIEIEQHGLEVTVLHLRQATHSPVAGSTSGS